MIKRIKQLLPAADDCRPALLFLCLLVAFPFDLVQAASLPDTPERIAPDIRQDLAQAPQPSSSSEEPYLDVELAVPREEADTTQTVLVDPDSPYGLDGKKIFNPDPERAVWLSALFPGLGQIYNRRYWKLPIIVGGFMGLGYATGWNNTQYQDYTQGYRDLLDNDPDTKSYMDFFPPTTQESDLDKAWLETTLRNRKNYYRRNRDLCIICIVGLYLLCMLDAYVDASMAHFDISPDLSMDVSPSLILSPADRRPSAGLTWALTF